MAQRAPLTPRETRLIEYLHSTQDVFFRYGDWPGYLQEMILLPHKKDRERFTLFFFLVGNGLDPFIASQWALILDVRPWQGRPRVILGTYDDAAQRHMAQLRKQLREENLFKGEKSMIDMTLGRVVLM